MLSYCSQYRKDAESKNPRVVNPRNWRITLLSKCAVCDIKKLISMKEQEAGGLLSSLGIRIPLSKILSVGPVLF